MSASSPFFRALREAAPTLSKRFFGCQSRGTEATRHHFGDSIPSTFTKLSTRRTHSTDAQKLFASRWSSAKARTNMVKIYSRAFSQSARRSDTAAFGEQAVLKKSRFPDASSNTVAYWLLGSAASVFGIVVFGGLTRLTESGYV